MSATSRPLRFEKLETRRVLDGTALFAAGDVVPDFSLVDVNQHSTTFNQAVSPRSQLGQVSAWYFGHAT